MDFMDKDLNTIIDKSFLLKDKEEETLKISKLKYELVKYNRQLHELITNNRINFHNEISFIMEIKRIISDKELLPLVLCFLCDNNYIKKVKEQSLSLIEIGDIAAYVLLKTNIEKFLDEIKCIQEEERKKNPHGQEEREVLKKLKTLVSETYERCNNIQIIREQNGILDIYKEKYITNFIHHNLKVKTIDHRIYIKKMAEGKEGAEEYLKDITKKFLRFNREEYIKEVEHVNEFYNILEKILKEEMSKEVETIISEFVYRAIFI
jgi:hypothetical protein